MKKKLASLSTAFQAARQLGFSQVFNYARYQIGLRSGYYRRITPQRKYAQLNTPIRSPFRLPDQSRLEALLKGYQEGSEIDRIADLIAEADEIANGKIRLFGGPLVPLELKPPRNGLHWTAYEGKPSTWGVEDIKYVWEPARFGWVYPLGRAYYLTRDERYPAAFWKQFITFLVNNPPNQGPNWASAQEVALRMLAVLFAACVFENSAETSPERMRLLAGVVEAHASRIPATLNYARAQNNNHLISEALGLYAAGHALTDSPHAKQWKKTGWKWLNHALQNQIAADGTYAQHSTNYHRLMLHAALLATLIGQPYPPATRKRLAAAATWLLAQVDPHSGRVPNLGSNDGAHILPLASGGFSDYRPVCQAAARAFIGQPAFPPGPWDELGLWLGQERKPSTPLASMPECTAVRRIGSPDSWAVLRAVRFTSRPAHADQLHVDLWWQGENIAMDAGTYRYTAPEPWDNALAHTLVHNTIQINNQNQMKRAGRFLWLDWAQAEKLSTRTYQTKVVGAQHHGYGQYGVIHRRILNHNAPDRWQVLDYLLAAGRKKGRVRECSFHLHWLLPDWPWEMRENTLVLARPTGGHIRLTLALDLPQPSTGPIGGLSLIRAGHALFGDKNCSPVLGWYSPTYGHKIPALSFSMHRLTALPTTITSEWTLE
jgi:hypothetical protein